MFIYIYIYIYIGLPDEPRGRAGVAELLQCHCRPGRAALRPAPRER